MKERREKLTLRRMTELALLTALSLIIFVIELQLPALAPIPGMKLGLANIITVCAVYRFSAGEVSMLLLARILLSAMFTGNVTALIYSLSGGALCLCGMLLLRHIIPVKFIPLCSVFGAVFHNIGQVAAAVAVMGTWTVIAYLPFLLVSGCIAGAFTGLCAGLVLRRLEKKR